MRARRAAMERARAEAVAEPEAAAPVVEVAPVRGVVEMQRMAGRARAARARAESEERAVVRLGRELGVSWDRIGVQLGLSGETLRRRHASSFRDGA